MTLGSSSDSHINTENLLNEQPCIFKSGCKSIKNKPSPFLRKKIPLLLTAIPRVTVSTAFLTWHNSNKQLLFQLLLLLQFSLNHCCTTLSIYLCCLLYHLCRSSLFWKSHQDFKLYSRFWIGKAIVKYWVWLVTLFGIILTLCHCKKRKVVLIHIWLLQFHTLLDMRTCTVRVNDKGPKGTISSLSILNCCVKLSSLTEHVPCNYATSLSLQTVPPVIIFTEHTDLALDSNTLVDLICSGSFEELFSIGLKLCHFLESPLCITRLKKH